MKIQFRYLATVSAVIFSAPATANAFRPVDLNQDGSFESILQVSTNTLWVRNTGLSGLRTFPSATSWAASLNVDGSNGWRLPELTELQSLYTGLKGSFGSVTNGPFTNVQVQRYWSTTPAINLELPGWLHTLDLRNGLVFQHSPTSSIQLYSWAVQAVPEPTTALLLALGSLVLAMRLRSTSDA